MYIEIDDEVVKDLKNLDGLEIVGSDSMGEAANKIIRAQKIALTLLSILKDVFDEEPR